MKLSSHNPFTGTEMATQRIYFLRSQMTISTLIARLLQFLFMG
jgi:hypothetical protein